MVAYLAAPPAELAVVAGTSIGTVLAHLASAGSRSGSLAAPSRPVALATIALTQLAASLSRRAVGRIQPAAALRTE